MDRTKKYTFLALLTTGALALSAIESMIPLPFIAPGAKLGLANMVILSVLVVFGFRSALYVSILRCFLFLMIAGNPIGFIYSLSGGISSVIVMFVVFKHLSKFFSLIGVSVFGAITYNTAQIAAASIILENLNIFTYLPVMSIMSLFTGCFIGYVSIFIVRYLKDIVKNNKRG